MTPDPALHQRIADSFAAQSLMATLGARLQSVREGEVRIVLPWADHLSQQQGFVHAGAISSVLDSACGYAALTRAPAGCEVVTAEFKINLVRPAVGAHFVAIGRVQHAGQRLTVCSGEVLACAVPLDEATAQSPMKVVALMQATVVNVPVS